MTYDHGDNEYFRNTECTIMNKENVPSKRFIQNTHVN